MKKDKHLPMYGVGPLYVIVIAALTVVGVTLSLLGYLDLGKFEVLKISFFIIGIILIIYGIILWIYGAIFSKITKGVYENKLITNGAYSIVRNPIYSAFLILFTGICFMFNNLFLLILPIIYYLFLTILMIHTEEKWLYELYKEEYKEYCKHVNRCIPIFKLKKHK